jgi:beta-lactamase class A
VRQASIAHNHAPSASDNIDRVIAMKKAFFLTCLLLIQSLPALSADDLANVLGEIRNLERAYGGHAGVMAKNLDTGEVVAFNAGERFPTASVIKLPVMAAFFGMVDKKEIDPGMRIILTREDKKGGSGILQNLDADTNLSLLDAVRLMIVLSDNTATNLVLDRLAPDHEARMKKVNDFLLSTGLKDTRILNRLYSLSTKQQTPEAIRYGIGVSTPADMVQLLEKLHSRKLAEPSTCDQMLEILKQQFYGNMIPRLLPREGLKTFAVANKTGFVNETKVDVALILSDRVKLAVAIFIDKNPDHRDIPDNNALVLAAKISRAVWNYFTGSTGYDPILAPPFDVDWNSIPSGRWCIYRSGVAPFPHKSRENGFRASDGTEFPAHPHYDDNSVVVFVPQGFRETPDGSNVIVHFHGHMNDNLGVLEQYGMLQTLAGSKVNALLVLAQGPYRSRDSSGGKIEDPGGFGALVHDVLSTMKNEQVIQTDHLRQVIVSAHSGGYRPAAFSLERGGIPEKVSHVFLFDAFYGLQPYFGGWLEKNEGRIFGCYTNHLAKEHQEFEKGLSPENRKKVRFSPTTVEHDKVIQAYFGEYLRDLDGGWK